MRGVIGSIFTAAVAVVAGTAGAADPAASWFGGPSGSGDYGGVKGLPVKWSAEGDGIKWKAELPGRGLSQPVVAGGRVFVTACTGTNGDTLHVLAFNLADGKKLWERRLAGTGLTGCHPKTNMAAPTPVTDGKRVYALFATCDLVAFDVDGGLAWYRSLFLDHPKISNQVGMAGSPVLADGVLVFSLESGAESLAFGIDADKGTDRWTAPRNREINWTTPVVLKRNGRTEVLLQSRTELTSYAPADGKVLWQHKAPGLASISSPAAAGDMVLVPGGDLTALRPPTEDGQTPTAVWSSPKLRPGTATVLHAAGKVYSVSGAGILTCAGPADGAVEWQLRLKGPYSASPIHADGKLYLVNEEGETSVVSTAPGEAGGGAAAAAKRLLGVNKLGETILAIPTVAEGCLLFRSDKHLWCVGAGK